MKNLIFICLLGIALSACNHAKNDQKQLQETVIKIHDKVMPKGGQVMNNKMRLDTLSNRLDSLKQLNPSMDTVAEKQHMKALIAQLENADNAMSDWMHQFNPDHEGKKHEEVMKYLNNEKQKVEAIDKQFSAIIDESNQYLSTYKVK